MAQSGTDFGDDGPDVGSTGLVVSAVFHVALLGAVVFGLPELFKHEPPEDTPIAVQLVNLSDVTRATQLTKTPPKPNAKPEPQIAQATPEPKPEPPKQEPPKPAPPPPPPPPAPTPEPEAPKPPEPKPEPPKPEPPKPEPPKPEPPKPPPPVAAPKPKPEPPKPDKEKLQVAEFDALLKNLTKRQTAPTPAETNQKAKSTSAPQQASSQPIAPLGAQLTVSEKDLLKRQIEDCWSFDPGAKGIQDMTVDVRIEVNQDRTVSSPPQIVSTERMSDPVYRSLAESALRAFKKPACQTLLLPPDKYETWKTTTVTFNPKDLLR